MTDRNISRRFSRPLLYLIVLSGLFFSAFAQEKALDFTHGSLDIKFLPFTKSTSGVVDYQFTVLERTDSLYIDARNMQLGEVMVNDRKAKYSYDKKQLAISIRKLREGEHHLHIAFEAQPQKALYFLGWADQDKGNEQIWSQGQGQNNSHWVPSFEDLSEKMTYTLRFEAPEGYRLLSNGVLEESSNQEGKSVWQFEQKQPISAYLLAVALGNYREYQQSSSSGIPLFQYLYPQDSLKYPGTFGQTKAVFDFLEAELGVPYPFDNYKEVPVFDFLYAGMENASCTLFSDQFVTGPDAIPQEAYLGVQAHELAHQWWGNLVTEASGKDHWLHEGFATYYAQLAEKSIRGEDWYYWNLLDKALLINGAGEQSLLDPKASSLTFYEKGALALVFLRELLGEEAFKSTMEKVLTTYSFQNLSVEQFLNEAEWKTEEDRMAFENTWLKATEFPWELVSDFLGSQKTSIQGYIQLMQDIDEMEEASAKTQRITDFAKSADLPALYRVLRDYGAFMEDEFLWELLERSQSMAGFNKTLIQLELTKSIGEILPENKELFEKLLLEAHSETVEQTLVKLSIAYPQETQRFVRLIEENTASTPRVKVMGALMTALTAADQEVRASSIDQMKAYLSAAYDGETRLSTAVFMVNPLGIYSTEVLDALLQLSTHHKWRVRKYAGRYMVEMMDKEEVRQWYEKVLSERSEEEQKRLAELLELSKTQE